MSTIKVNNIESSTGGGVAAKLASVNGGFSGTKNLIINGSCIVAQRGVSSTADGYLIDRFNVFDGSSLDESVTRAQVDVASGTTPYTLGFRKALKLTNGNQTSGAQADSNVQIRHKLEAQDIANSGWNYTSASSFITLSFWVKSRVAQNFYVNLRTTDGTGQRYSFETGSLSANTWTKVTNTIAGNSNLTFDNDNGEGLEINISPYWGTNYTDSGVSLNTWGAYASGTRTPDFATTWFTTNDATFEVTGVQLEVGNVATDFEHRSFGQELQLCKRYFQHAGGAHWGATEGGQYYRLQIQLEPEMRTSPTVTVRSGGVFNTRSSGADVAITNPTKGTTAIKSRYMWTTVEVSSGSLTNNRTVIGRSANINADYLNCDAEL